MLSTLRLRNFVLIDQLELQLGSGLNVITGETGAGKSILVDALGLLLGGRASPDVVRTGANEAELEALFDLPAHEAAAAHVVAQGVPFEGELVIRRVIAQTGRSRVYLNGRLSTVTELSALGPLLLDIASQHESVSLTDPTTHLTYLDTFAQLDTEREAVAREVDALRALLEEVKREEVLIHERAQREAFLGFQLASIDEVAPQAGEQDALLLERGRLRHASRLLDIARRGAHRLEEQEGALADELGRIVAEVRGASELDAALRPVAQTLEDAHTELVEAARTLARYAERIDADPGRLGEIEERLFALEKLKRQHGSSLEDVVASRVRIVAELDVLAGSEERLQRIEASCVEQRHRAAQLAQALSRKRKQTAEKLGQAITRELVALGMGAAKVIVEVAPLERGIGVATSNDSAEPAREQRNVLGSAATAATNGRAADIASPRGPSHPAGARRPDVIVIDGARLTRDGMDRVEFLIAPNKGVEPRPLRKIASGGELSRALLALKRVLADAAPAGTYVFDEVDAGVGGAIAERIGRALSDVAQHRQVICITHLAPIAAFGTTHFIVEKGVRGESTRSTIGQIQGAMRVQELARMMSGATVTEAARRAAVELLQAAGGVAQVGHLRLKKLIHGGDRQGTTNPCL